MRTKIIDSADVNAYVSAIDEVVRALGDGALVVFPTETVYGVAASAVQPEAMRRLRAAKQCDEQRPFTVHLGRRTDARKYVRSPSPLLRRLARKSWPGPLTLLAEEPAPEQTEIARSCPREQLGEIFHEGTVGLRCPRHVVAERLLSAAGVPVVASSANRQGNPPPLALESALRDLDGRVDYALDAGRTRFNSPSTVVAVRGNEWELRRAGVVEERTIRRLAQAGVLFVCTGNSCRSPLAEYLFRHKLAERLGYSLEELAAAGYVVASAGTIGWSGGEISDGSRAELARRGIDSCEHRSQPLTTELIQQMERIYVMTPEHRAAALDLAPGAASRVEPLDPDGPVSDPIGGGSEQYQHCAERIERLVEARLKEFLDEDLDWQ